MEYASSARRPACGAAPRTQQWHSHASMPSKPDLPPSSPKLTKAAPNHPTQPARR